MVQIRVRKGLSVVKDVGTKRRKDGEASGCGTQGGDFGHP